jgi:type IV pilus assembly protein PilB
LSLTLRQTKIVQSRSGEKTSAYLTQRQRNAGKSAEEFRKREERAVKKKKLGEVLRERGHISSTNLAQALGESAAEKGKAVLLGELLLERGLVDKGQLASALEVVTNIPYVDCSAVSPEPAALRKVSWELARKCLAFPIAHQGSKLVVVMAEPQNLTQLDEIKFTAGINVSPRFGFRQEIIEAIDIHYAAAAAAVSDDATEELPVPGASQKKGGPDEIEFISTSSRQANREAAQEIHAELLHKTTPAVRVVSEVIRGAHGKRASDIHIEPQATEVVVRIRVDGVLRDLRRVQRNMQNSLISRIKILADMDIAERRTPQDGRFMVRLGASSIDMRVSTLPTQYGEKVVMRLLDSAMGIMNLSDLNMPAKVESSMRQVLALPQGMLLVTGPTGSGKSTTLYAALNQIRHTAVNIVTVEDPVEYVLPGINQVHVNNKAGLTFASCLRSILRQDPNVVMIGEIRDKETAEIALKAAQTGHLLLSTLHTNDSLSAVTRLLDLGIPAFMIASSVTGILAQRLVRRLCSCREQVAPTAAALQRLAGLGMTQPIDHLFTAVGCDACDQTGYKGRIGVYEILVFDDGVREAVRSGQNSDSIRNALRGMGLKLMQDDAVEKIQQGITSLEEIARVVPVQTIPSAGCPQCGQQIFPTFRFCPSCGTEQPKAGVAADRKSSKRNAEESLIL